MATSRLCPENPLVRGFGGAPVANHARHRKIAREGREGAAVFWLFFTPYRYHLMAFLLAICSDDLREVSP